MSELKKLPAGHTLYTYDTLTSTMDEAHRLAREGAPAYTLILADKQTQGRGRRGGTWSSPPGNLHLSCIWRPSLTYEQINYLSFLLPVAAGNALLPFLPDPSLLQYKWPNDILIDSKKVGGCLIESEPDNQDSKKPQWVVGGLGLNFNVAPHFDVSYQTTSFAEQGIKITCKDFLPYFCVECQALLSALEESGFETLRTMWLARAWGTKELLTVVVDKDTSITGTMHSITPDGKLCLREKSEKKTIISSGHVLPESFSIEFEEKSS